LAKRFQRADVACEEGEHCDAYAALPWNAEDGVLEESWGGVLVPVWEPEAVVEGSAEVREDD